MGVFVILRNAAFLIVTLLCAPSSCTTMTRPLHCSGEYSRLTHDDCQTKYYENPAACYLDPISSTYTPCAEVCRDLVYPSRGAERCQSYCPDYYRNSCSYLPDVTTEATGHGLKDMVIVGIVIGAVVVVMVVAVLIVKFVILPKRRQPDAAEGKEALGATEDPNPHTPNPPRQRTDSDVEPLIA